MRFRISSPPRRGQAVVEFAFVLLMFVVMTMGIVDLGRAVLYNNMLSNAAREGARKGILSSATLASMCTVALSQVLAPGVNHAATCPSSGSSAVVAAGDLTIKLSLGTAPTSTTAGTANSVELDYTFRPITPLIAQIVGSSMTLKGTSSMYVEP